MAPEPSLRIVMDGDQFKLEGVDPLEAKRAEIRAQMEADAATEAEIAASRLSISEHLMVLGLRKASKDELRRIILDALAVEAAA